MAYTQTQLRQGLLEDIGDYFSGTTTSAGDATSVIDSSAVTLTEHEKDECWLYIADNGGNIARESRKITSFDTTTGDFTVRGGFTEAPGTSVDYIISQWSHDEIERALNKAMRIAGLMMKDYDSTSLDWIENTYIYTTPAGLADYEIYKIEINGTPSTVWTPIRGWRREKNETEDTLHFYSGHTAGKDLKLWYRKPHTSLSTEASEWDLTEKECDLIYAYASMELYRLLFHRAVADMKDDIMDKLSERQSVLRERKSMYGPVPETMIARSYMN